MNTIAVVGATGYLGSFVCQSLQEQGYQVRYLVRSGKKLIDAGISPEHIRQIDVTSPVSLQNQLTDVDCVISCLGITRQKDGLSYMDVDFQANANVLDEAVKAGVSKFIYVSVFRGNQYKNVALCNAKEHFVDYLKHSGMPYCVVRPTGFFSDMKDFWDMAKNGRAYLFGDGSKRLNPIHGKDLAETIVSRMHLGETELNVGGPQAFTQAEIAALAFTSLQQANKITMVPDVFRRAVLWFGKRFMPESTFGPVEFFLTLLAKDMVAPSFGHRTLNVHFDQLSELKQSSVVNPKEEKS